MSAMMAIEIIAGWLFCGAAAWLYVILRTWTGDLDKHDWDMLPVCSLCGLLAWIGIIRWELGK